jgi:hypothetical protein
MKWVPKHLREPELRLEKVQTEPMALRLFIGATSVIHPTIRFTTTYTSKQLWKCLRGKVQL